MFIYKLILDRPTTNYIHTDIPLQKGHQLKINSDMYDICCIRHIMTVEQADPKTNDDSLKHTIVETIVHVTKLN